MDNLTWYEIEAIVDAGYERYKDDWEKARFIAYVYAQTQTTDRLKPEDILQFPWEIAPEDKLTEAEIRQRANSTLQEYQKLMNGTR